MTSNEDMTELYGEPAPFSDYHPGDRVTYRRAGEVVTGEILWACAAGPSLSGTPLPLRYFVAPDQGGFPDSVWQSDIIGTITH